MYIGSWQTIIYIIWCYDMPTAMNVMMWLGVLDTDVYICLKRSVW